MGVQADLGGGAQVQSFDESESYICKPKLNGKIIYLTIYGIGD